MGGGSFDVRGKHGEVYCLFSTHGMAVNAQWSFVSFVLPQSDPRSAVIKKVHGSVLSAGFVTLLLPLDILLHVHYSPAKPYSATMKLVDGDNTEQRTLDFPARPKYQ